jgi:SAM-dependent methyltransferase
MDVLFFIERWTYWTGGLEGIEQERIAVTISNEVRERALRSRSKDLSQEERLLAPAFIPYRAPKDPRELKILDPACGSGHFLLYCFELLETIYEEAYEDERIGRELRTEYSDRNEFRRAVPVLILRHNLYGIDIDVRATQISALALWLRAQRAYGELRLKDGERPRITRSNIVCAEPMPGEHEMLEEFAQVLEPTVLGQLVEVVFDKMKLAGEAGSLLKIEEEIEDVIARALAQWQREFDQATDRRGNELLLTHSEMDRLSSRANTQMDLFEVSQVTDQEFWVQVESQVIEALRSYSTGVTNGESYQRRLFADDAAQGFAFVDICRKRFDVVLMNPPFGASSTQSKKYIDGTYTRSKHDLACAFVDRWIGRLEPEGLLGAITTRTPFFNEYLSKWRQQVVLRESTLKTFLDLGDGVLDATIETSAYVLRRKHESTFSEFLRLSFDRDKQYALRIALADPHDERRFMVSTNSLAKVPSMPFCYWTSDNVRELFARGISVESNGCVLGHGAATLDNERFLRLAWEVQPVTVGREARWVPITKGGEYSPFVSNFDLLILWEDDGAELKAYASNLRSGRGWSAHWTAVLNSYEHYFRPGITWPARPHGRGSFALLPSGMIFTHMGMALLGESQQLLSRLCVMNSRVYLGLLNLLMPRGSDGTQGMKYELGYIRKIPMPHSIDERELQKSLNEYARAAVAYARRRFHDQETSSYFTGPIGLSSAQTLRNYLSNARDRRTEVQKAISNKLQDIDRFVAEAYSLSDSDTKSLQDSVIRHEDIVEGPPSDDELLHDYCSWVVGAILGRWDLRIALDPTLAPRLGDIFAPTRTYSPATLIGPDGLPARRNEIVSKEWLQARQDASTPPEGSVESPSIQDSEYPLAVDWDGILVDDPNHADDIVHRVRDVLELLWDHRADTIEGETCEILGIKDLRTYFRNPRKFFDYHIKRYSKSRRKAPIYWLLQSPKRNYGLWLYYHRLDPDILFKALHKYVEPKVRLEESRLDEYEARRRSAGTVGREARQAEKTAEKQEELLTDLREFRDRLERAAKLHLRPDLNDGVVLNIAPLHELAPWKEAKSKWNELLAGKYEWSSIGKQLREKGMV